MILDKKAITLTRAIAYAEHGGKPPVVPPAGKTGELPSLFQYTPDTWKEVAAKYLGNANAELTSENEIEATYKRVKGWLDDNNTPAQIASMWNAGEGEPDAYTGQFSNGVSSIRKGVAGKHDFDVPGYANTVQKYAEQLWNETPTITSMPIIEDDGLSFDEKVKQKQTQYWAEREELEKAKGNTFLQNIINAPVTVITRIGQLATLAGVNLFGSDELKTAMSEVVEEPLDLGFLGTIAAQKSWDTGGGKQVVALATEMAAWLVPPVRGLKLAGAVTHTPLTKFV